MLSMVWLGLRIGSVDMPRYPVRGISPETGQPVHVEMGWAEDIGFFFGVDQGDQEIASGTEISSLPELIDKTRAWVTWDRRLYNAMRDLPAVTYLIKYPGSPVAKILGRVR